MTLELNITAEQLAVLRTLHNAGWKESYGDTDETHRLWELDKMELVNSRTFPTSSRQYCISSLGRTILLLIDDEELLLTFDSENNNIKEHRRIRAIYTAKNPCSWCEKETYRHSMVGTIDGKVCLPCAKNNYTFCDHCTNNYPNTSNYVVNKNGKRICQSCLEEIAG